MKQPKFTARSSRTADKFVVRLPDGMRETIAEVAKDHHRSMNSEIIARLERSLAEEEGAAEIHIDTQTLSVGEKHMLKSFRAMSVFHQKALMDLLTQQPTSVQSVPHSKVA